MDDVKVHYNSPQPAQLNALAYAQGTDIHIGPGQEKHLPHEAWHVTQQKQGRVKPTLQMKEGIPVNDDQGLEQEADIMGSKAIQMFQFDDDSGRKSSAAVLTNSKDFFNQVTQCVWKTMGPTELRWEGIVNGIQWFYDLPSQKFFYRIVVDNDVPIELWDGIEANESELLSQEQLSHLGFVEMRVAETERRIEYEAPAPKFGPMSRAMVTVCDPEKLAVILQKHLVQQTVHRNYDRMVYVNAFRKFQAQNPHLSPDLALAQFDPQSVPLLESELGGHCGALSGELIKGGQYGPGAYLVASKLPSDFQQKGAPEYCHVAAMIRFQHPDTAENNGLILLEPGFNITTPIIIRMGLVTKLPVGTDEIWEFSVDKTCTEVTCQPVPVKGNWAPKKSRDKKMTYRTDVFLNPDMSLTSPLLKMDGRPQILARDEKGDVVALIAVNYGKRVIEFRIGTNKFTPVSFDTVIKGGKAENWLGDAAVPLAKLLKISAPELLERIHSAVIAREKEK